MLQSPQEPKDSRTGHRALRSRALSHVHAKRQRRRPSPHCGLRLVASVSVASGRHARRRRAASARGLSAYVHGDPEASVSNESSGLPARGHRALGVPCGGPRTGHRAPRRGALSHVPRRSSLDAGRIESVRCSRSRIADSERGCGLPGRGPTHLCGAYAPHPLCTAAARFCCSSRASAGRRGFDSSLAPGTDVLRLVSSSCSCSTSRGTVRALTPSRRGLPEAAKEGFAPHARAAASAGACARRASSAATRSSGLSRRGPLQVGVPRASSRRPSRRRSRSARASAGTSKHVEERLPRAGAQLLRRPADAW